MYSGYHYKPENLILVRSDAGDGGWSLHSPWATDDQIADGREPALQDGTATMDENEEWDRPNKLDYQMAFNVMRAREKAAGR